MTMPEHVMFSEAKIELCREARKHPALVDLLANHDPNDFETQLAEIAAYVGVVVHGDYIPAEIDGLCAILHTKLRGKRAGIVIP